MKTKLSAILLMLSFLLCGCSEKAFKPYEINDTAKETKNLFAMNTYITLAAYGENTSEALDRAEERIHEIESVLSVTDKNSEIYAVNHSNGISVKLSPDTESVLSFALEMAQKTNGALEPTIYPVLTAWGFTTENYQVPTQEKIDQLMQSVDFQKVRIENHALALPGDMQLDLGAVAKGYAGDEITSLLKSNGITSAIINLGGNVQTIGTRPDGSMWRVGLKAPNSDGHIGILEVSECAVITSGGYQKYFTGEDDKRYHHIIDPATGRPAESGLVSVTVIGKEGKLCDALSTALFVMGTEDAIAYWKQYGDFEMILLTDKDEIYITEGLENCFTLQKEYDSYPVMVIHS